MRFCDVLFWMMRFLSCHRDGRWIGRTMDLFCDRPRQDMEVGVTDITQDIPVLPNVFPAIFDETAAVPMFLPVVVDTGPHVDAWLSGMDMGVEVMNITQDIHVLPDVFPAMFDETAAMPLSSPVVIDTGPQVDSSGRPRRRWSPR